MTSVEPSLSEQIKTLSLAIQETGRRSRYLVNAVDSVTERLISQCCSEDSHDLDTILVFCDMAREAIERAEEFGEQIEKITHRVKADA